jgi:hypothetical protein
LQVGGDGINLPHVSSGKIACVVTALARESVHTSSMTVLGVAPILMGILAQLPFVFFKALYKCSRYTSVLICVFRYSKFASTFSCFN